MKPIEVHVKQTFFPKYLIVRAEVRYWEDATVNGQVDSDGTLIPFRDGDDWRPVIELDTGRVSGRTSNWPLGVSAKVHYKVCDAGKYWLCDDKGNRLQWLGDYVPNDLLAAGNGSGDYIIMTIGEDGIIENWKPPVINPEEWENCIV